MDEEQLYNIMLSTTWGGRDEYVNNPYTARGAYMALQEHWGDMNGGVTWITERLAYVDQGNDDYVFYWLQEVRDPDDDTIYLEGDPRA